MAKLNCTTGNFSGLKFRNEKGVKKHQLTTNGKALEIRGEYFIDDAEISKRDRSRRIQ